MQLQGEGRCGCWSSNATRALSLRATAQWSDARERAARRGDARGSRRRRRAAAGSRSRSIRRARVRSTRASSRSKRLGRGTDRALSRNVGADREPAGARGRRNDRVRGLLVQRMPGATRGRRRHVDDRGSHRRRASRRATSFAPSEHRGAARGAVPRRGRPGVPRCGQPRFACSCSRERVENALRMIGRARSKASSPSKGKVGVTCEFCNRQLHVRHRRGARVVRRRPCRLPPRATRSRRRIRSAIEAMTSWP